MLRKHPSTLLMLLVLFLGLLSKVGEAAQKQLPRPLVEQFFLELTSAKATEEEQRNWRKNLRWDLHDLNGDSVLEYFLYVDHHDWCGAGGSNCEYSIYKKTEKGFRLLLKAPRVFPLKSSANGYRNLVSDTRQGISEKPGYWEYSRTIYKFDGRQYRQQSEKMILKRG